MKQETQEKLKEGEKLKFGKIEYNGTNDYVAKRIWSNPTNFKNLVYKTLGVVLDEDKIVYTTNEDRKEINGKGNHYDVTVRYGTDINMIVEPQNYQKGITDKNRYSDYIINRSIHYISSAHCTLYKRTDEYYINKYTYLIWVCKFEIPNDEGISIFTYSNGHDEFDRTKIVFVSLPNIEKDAKMNSKTKEFFNVLKTNDLSKYKNSESEVIEVAKIIADVNKDSDEQFLAELARMNEMARRTELKLSKEEGLAEGKAEGLAEGKAEGLAEGRAEATKEMILKMHKLGLSIDIISQTSGLTIKEIEDIINNNL